MVQVYSPTGDDQVVNAITIQSQEADETLKRAKRKILELFTEEWTDFFEWEPENWDCVPQSEKGDLDVSPAMTDGTPPEKILKDIRDHFY